MIFPRVKGNDINDVFYIRNYDKNKNKIRISTDVHFHYKIGNSLASSSSYIESDPFIFTFFSELALSARYLYLSIYPTISRSSPGELTFIKILVFMRFASTNGAGIVAKLNNTVSKFEIHKFCAEILKITGTSKFNNVSNMRTLNTTNLLSLSLKQHQILLLSKDPVPLLFLQRSLCNRFDQDEDYVISLYNRQHSA